MLDRLDDTIVAISSAPGTGAMGIVRLSGPRAIDIASRVALVADGEPLSSRAGSTRVRGEVRIDDDLSLPATFYVFRAPRSYTRQDLVEIQTIGSPAVLQTVRRRLAGMGAALAQRGEFTARAFLAGAMDLASAEGVASLIRAQTDTQLRASRRMMDGALARRIQNLQEDLGRVVALVEADIDFTEEPIEFITPKELERQLGTLADQLASLRKGSTSVERLDVVPHILLLGLPNVGKSTLMNRLSGQRRAICAAASGTTRDLLSAPISLGRCEAILLDSAGVDRSVDQIATQARDVTLTTASRVDLVCLVADLVNPDEVALSELVNASEGVRMVIAANKRDLISSDLFQERIERLDAMRLGPTYAVSALEGTGIAEFRAALGEALGGIPSTTLGEAILVSQRQRTALDEAAEAVERAIDLSTSAKDTIDCAEVVAFELRDALDSLGMVTGTVTTEELLGQVFANFCIGK